MRTLMILTICLTASLLQAQSVDLTPYTQLLKQYVNNDGLVDYVGLKAHRQPLDRFVASLGAIQPDVYKGWSDKRKIATLINAYNAFTLTAIIDHYPIQSSWWRSLKYPANSIRQIPGVWDELKFKFAGQSVVLEQIENDMLRKQFHEPRIHMAINCASRGCPPLRNESFAAEKLDQQLDDQARRFVSNSTKFRIDRARNTVYLSPIFKWFAEDFGDDSHSVTDFIARYVNDKDAAYLKADRYELEYLDYDWSLNKQPKS